MISDYVKIIQRSKSGTSVNEVHRKDLQKYEWTYFVEIKEKIGDIWLVTTAIDFGHRCGYVGIPKWHPYYKIILENDPEAYFNVHGGITYSDHELPAFVGDDKIANHFWLGFDCGHAGDARDPSIFDKSQFEFQKQFIKRTGMSALIFEGSEIRTAEYVYRECFSLVMEIVDLYKANTSRLQRWKDRRKTSSKEFKKYIEYLHLKDILKD